MEIYIGNIFCLVFAIEEKSFEEVLDIVGFVRNLKFFTNLFFPEIVYLENFFVVHNGGPKIKKTTPKMVSLGICLKMIFP